MVNRREGEIKDQGYGDSNDAFGDVICALSGKKVTDFSAVEVDLVFGDQGSEDGAVN